MKKNVSATSNKVKVLFTNQFSSGEELAYKASYTGNRSGKIEQYKGAGNQEVVAYWSNNTENTTFAINHSPDLRLQVNEMIEVELLSNKSLRSITLYTSSGIPLFMVENVTGQKISLPRPVPGRYFVEAQFQCSKTVQQVEIKH